MEKDYEGWHRLKTKLNAQAQAPTIHEREIWWCSIGANIGEEMEGKSELFSRPVLVVRKFSQRRFLGAPTTTKVKDYPFYHPFQFHGKAQCLVLSQLRVWDSRRLTRKMGEVSPKQFGEIREALKALL